MRFHVRRLFVKILFLTLFFALAFHLYINGMHSGDQERLTMPVKPWGRDFDNRPLEPLKFVDKIVHDHVRAMAVGINGSTNYNVSKKGGATNSKFRSYLQEKEFGDPMKGTRIWPNQNYDWDDRIVAQMTHVPMSVRKEQEKPFDDQKLKTLLVWNGVGSMKNGRKRLIDDQCPVTQCYLTGDRSKVTTADLILFQHSITNPGHRRPRNQVWVLYFLESPHHTASLTSYKNLFNWTATYRHDSTIVAPYEKFVPFNKSVVVKPLVRNYAAGKTKKVAWFVSNCGARNKRKNYADELQKYIDVHIYGSCGPYKCPRFQSHKCFDLLNREYKFYLAFENSNCRDYITEKFFVTGLQHDVIPIVMGAHPDDYRRASPPHSFIHVDDFASPKELASYLHKLDQNDDLYNEYFRWKGTGQFINTFFWCRLCSMAWDDTRVTWYEDPNKWWRGDGVCIGPGRWRKATYGVTWS